MKERTKIKRNTQQPTSNNKHPMKKWKKLPRSGMLGRTLRIERFITGTIVNESPTLFWVDFAPQPGEVRIYPKKYFREDV